MLSTPTLVFKISLYIYIYKYYISVFEVEFVLKGHKRSVTYGYMV